MINKKEIKIVGAGISGLTAAIVLAKAGFKVKIFEQFEEVGKRFNEDFQGLENWSCDEDILDFLKRVGLKINFLYYPTDQVDGYSPNMSKITATSKKPLFYLVKRGSSDGCLDLGLKRQAQDIGVEINFNSKINNFTGDIIATGPMRDDFFWGFGMHYAIMSGYLAAKSIIENKNYDSLWKNEFKVKLEVSVTLRFLRKITGNFAISKIASKFSKSRDPIRFLRKLYSPSLLESMIFPLAKFTFRKYIKNYIY